MDFEEFDDSLELISYTPAVAPISAISAEDVDGDQQVSLGSSSQARLPEPVASFLINLELCIQEQPDIQRASQLYEHNFNRLTEKYYSKTAWPRPEAVNQLFQSNQQEYFILIYKELFYRHLHSKLQPVSLQDQIASFENYSRLFEAIWEDGWYIELPGQWLWDIVDEYIYQMETFNRVLQKAKDEKSFVAAVKQNPKLWSPEQVLNTLQRLAEETNINKQLEANNSGADVASVAGNLGSRPFFRMLGYFGLIGCLRVNCSLGNFQAALESVNSLQLRARVCEVPGVVNYYNSRETTQGLFGRVAACHVSTYYHVCFAYFMLRRFSDCIKLLSHILHFLARARVYNNRGAGSHQNDITAKKVDKMYALLAICVTLCPQRVEESVHTVLREKYGEQMYKMQKGHGNVDDALRAFEEAFYQASPKFVASQKTLIAGPVDAASFQQGLFLRDVRLQLHIPVIRSYLRLYSTISMEKLASFLEIPKESLAPLLLSYKLYQRQKRWESGPLVSGEVSGPTELDFYIDNGVIHVTESKVGRRFGDYFLRNINKMEELIQSLER